MRISEKKVLLFHIPQEKAETIGKILNGMGATAVAVSADQENAPLGLLSGAEDWNNVALMAGFTPAAPIDDEMLLIAGFEGQALDVLLAELRRWNVRVNYKAILTEQNAVWNAGQLFGQLKEEHRMFHKR